MGNKGFIRTGAEHQGWRTIEPHKDQYHYVDAGDTVYENYLKSAEYGKGNVYNSAKKQKGSYHLTEPGNKDFYSVWRQNRIKLTYLVREGWSSTYTELPQQNKGNIWAGKLFEPEKHPEDKLVFLGWKNKDSNEFMPDEKYRVLKSTVMYAAYDDLRKTSDKKKVTLLSVSLPVGKFGEFAGDYKETVARWAEKYARIGYQKEYGCVLYKVSGEGKTSYATGETYSGYKTKKWYTVLNGLLAGNEIGNLAIDSLELAGTFLGHDIRLEKIGFLHTHPVGRDYEPSDPWDLRMRKLGNFYRQKEFPIAVCHAIDQYIPGTKVKVGQVQGSVDINFNWYK